MFDSPEGPKQKGLKRIARERGVPNWNSSKEVLVAIANTWPDFQNIKPLLVEEVEACGPNFIIKFLPKFHCELNPIEMVRFALMWQRSLLCLLGSLLVMNCCLFLSLVWQLWGGAKRLLRHVLDGKFATLRKHLDAYLCQVGRNMSYVGNWFGHVQKFIDAYALGSSLGTATASVKKSHRCASRMMTTTRVTMTPTRTSTLMLLTATLMMTESPYPFLLHLLALQLMMAVSLTSKHKCQLHISDIEFKIAREGGKWGPMKGET